MAVESLHQNRTLTKTPGIGMPIVLRSEGFPWRSWGIASGVNASVIAQYAGF